MLFNLVFGVNAGADVDVKITSFVNDQKYWMKSNGTIGQEHTGTVGSILWSLLRTLTAHCSQNFGRAEYRT